MRNLTFKDLKSILEGFSESQLDQEVKIIPTGKSTFDGDIYGMDCAFPGTIAVDVAKGDIISLGLSEPETYQTNNSVFDVGELALLGEKAICSDRIPFGKEDEYDELYDYSYSPSCIVVREGMPYIRIGI